MNVYRVMDKLPSKIIQHIYEYDPTYKIKFDKVLIQLSAHCFTYNCHMLQALEQLLLLLFGLQNILKILPASILRRNEYL